MHFYMNKGWRLKRPVDVHLPPVDIAEAYRPLIDTCVETRDDYSEDGGLCCWQENVRILSANVDLWLVNMHQVSKSDSHGSSGCCTACTEYIPRVRMLGGFDGISAEEKSERIRVWVDCGTYGVSLSCTLNVNRHCRLHD